MKQLSIFLFLVSLPGIIQSQTISALYFAEGDYVIKKDTSFSSDFNFSWIEKSIHDSYIFFEYENQGKISREYYRDVELAFTINDKPVVSIRKEFFKDSVDFDYESIFILQSNDDLEYIESTTEARITIQIGKPETDYLVMFRFYFSKNGIYRYHRLKPVIDDAY